MAAKLIMISPTAPLCMMARKQVSGAPTQTVCGKMATKESKGFTVQDAAKAIAKMSCEDCRKTLIAQKKKAQEQVQEWKTIEIPTQMYKGYGDESKVHLLPKHFIQIMTEPIHPGANHPAHMIVEEGRVICAVKEWHASPDEGVCENFLPLTNTVSSTSQSTYGVDRNHWSLQALDPMSISPSINCVNVKECGLHGYLRKGKWDELNPTKYLQVKKQQLTGNSLQATS